MKNSLLIALLGLTVSVAAPSVASADSEKRFGPSKDYKFVKKQQKQKNRHVKKSGHSHKNNVVVKAKPRHQKPRQHNYKDNRRSKPQITVAWSSVGSKIVVSTNKYNQKNKHRNYSKPRYSASIYDRQNRQQQKINKGVRSGQLVRYEAQQLRQEQHNIDRKLSAYQRNGRLDRHEKAKIHKKLDIASNNIRSKMNNRVTRYSQPRYERDNRRYEYARR